MTDQDDMPSEKVELWLADALHEATEGLWLLRRLTKMPPTPARLDAATTRLQRASDACRRATDLLENTERRGG